MTELIYAPQNLWTNHHEKLLMKWRTTAIGLEWQHKQSAELYEYMNYIFGGIAIVMTMITSATFFVDANNSATCENDIVKKIAFGIVLAFASAITAMNTFFKYNELSEKHKNCADKWRNYINSIDAEFAFAKEERINGKVYLKQMQKRYSELIEICPNIPKFIQRKYAGNKDRLIELNEIIIDESIAKYTSRDNNSSPSVDGSSDDGGGKPDIQTELENELKGKQIKENVSKQMFDAKPFSRLVNL